MTLFVVPTGLAVFFFLASFAVQRASDARQARQWGIAIALTATLGSLIAGALQQSTLAEMANSRFAFSPTGLLSIAPIVTSLVALLSIALAPVQTHRTTTFVRMLWLFAIAHAFLATSHPLVLAPLWFASSFVAWLELRARSTDVAWHRVFAYYQGVGALFFTLGAFLMWQHEMSEIGMLLILLGIGLREGVIPFHSWFPNFVERAPMGLVVAFAAPQLGVYANIELLVPDSGVLVHSIAVMGVITAVVAAFLGVAQTNARRSIAYLMLSQTGLVAFGLETTSRVGRIGAILNWQVLALATTGFAMCLALLQARRGELILDSPRGTFAQTPRLAVSYLLLGLASVGLPATLGFVAEDLIVQGSVGSFPILGLTLVIATGCNGVTVLRSFFYLFTGSRKKTGEPDLNRREGAALTLAIALLLALGVFPGRLLKMESTSAPSTHSVGTP